MRSAGPFKDSLFVLQQWVCYIVHSGEHLESALVYKSFYGCLVCVAIMALNLECTEGLTSLFLIAAAFPINPLLLNAFNRPPTFNCCPTSKSIFYHQERSLGNTSQSHYSHQIWTRSTGYCYYTSNQSRQEMSLSPLVTAIHGPHSHHGPDLELIHQTYKSCSKPFPRENDICPKNVKIFECAWWTAIH